MSARCHAPSSGFLFQARIRAIEREHLDADPPAPLMARAALAVADAADHLLRQMPGRTRVLAAIGPGNNGADALLCLQTLARRGYRVEAHLLHEGEPGPPEAVAVHRQWLAAGGVVAPLQSLHRRLGDGPAPLLIDGLFGIGLSRPLGGSAARFAALTSRLEGPVLAVDVPSGLDPDTGSVVGGPLAAAVHATHTVTMIADKPGLWTGQGRLHAGQVSLASLGLPASVPDGLRIDRQWVRARLAHRSPVAHKGTFGTVAIVGGAAGMPGAALLAAAGARASGAGKVATLGPDGAVFDPGEPQTMAWQAERPSEFDALLATTDAIAVGCGLGQGTAARGLLGQALRQAVPLCLDADALNLLAATAAQDRARILMRERADLGRPTVITPHPLEAARLLGCSARDIEQNRIGQALALATRFACVVLLKGAGSVLAAPDGRWALITSGGPALATGGTGDVLAGLVTGLLAQGHSGWEAAAVAAWIHGDAADRWTVGHPRARGLSAPALVHTS
ncbi:MAG: NAD(P)H-hydrate dehydratase [Burkholderiaceae bacterium]